MINKIFSYYKKNGLRKLIPAVIRTLKNKFKTENVQEHSAASFNLPELKEINFVKNSRTDKKRRISLVLPSLEKRHFFAGAWTAVKFSWELRKKYGFRYRIICTDAGFDTETLSSLGFITKDEAKNIEGWSRSVDHSCVIEDDEIIVVTAWWTAELFKDFVKTNPTIYMVQDYEPGFYPWSYHYVAALNTYEYKYLKVFNTKLLYDFFSEKGLVDKEGSVYFEPGVDSNLHFPVGKDDYKRTKKVRIVVYGRMTTPRNLFELIVLSLEKFFSEYPEQKKHILEVVSVGSGHPVVLFSDGSKLVSRGKLTLEEWSDLTKKSNIGISLMCSPHPSYPPLEMISSGMLVITNNFAGKDLSKINHNFISADPTPEAISGALVEAIKRSKNQAEIKSNSLDYLKSHDWGDCLVDSIEVVGGKLGLK